MRKIKNTTPTDQTIRSIMERGPAVMYHCAGSWDDGVDYITPNVQELLGWDPASFTEQQLFRLELLHPEDLRRVLQDVPLLPDVGRQKHEYRMRCKDGHYVWVLDDMRKLDNGDGIVGYLTDITDLKAAEHSLRDSELRHRAIFETVLEGIITIDDKGIVKDMNPAAERMFAYSGDQVIGRNVSMLMPAPYAEQHDGYLARFLQTGEAKVIGIGRTVVGRRATGDTFEMHLSVSQLNLPQGRFFVGAVRDVSQRVRAEKELRTSQERLRMSQKFAKMGNWDWHIDSDELYWSEQMFDLYGIANDGEELRRERVYDWALPEDLSIVQDAIRRCLRDGGYFKCEYRVRKATGDVCWVREQGNVLRDEQGYAVRMLGVTQDISATKAYEEELKAAREAADNANRAKSDFLSRMSHELRTPLNAILGFAQLLEMSKKHPLAERQKRQVDQIIGAGNHLMNLINEVLDLARIEAGRLAMAIEPTNMQPIMEECIALTENAAAEKRLSLFAGPPPKQLILADGMRVKQVLINLLSNAVKFNKPGGMVRLEVVEQTGDMAEFRVIDNGKGIAAQKQSLIFTPFERLGEEGHGIEGTGIGLTLSKQLVEMMDGEIGFDSAPGVGSTFWMRLPIARQDDGARFIGERVEDTLCGKTKILLVEKNDQNVDFLQQMSSMLPGIDIAYADTVDRACDKALRWGADLILLDPMIDKDGGAALMARLKAMPEGYSPRIWALVDKEGEVGDTLCVKGDYDGVMTTPLQLREFKELANSLQDGKDESNNR